MEFRETKLLAHVHRTLASGVERELALLRWLPCFGIPGQNSKDLGSKQACLSFAFYFWFSLNFKGQVNFFSIKFSLRCRYSLRGHGDSVNSVEFLDFSNILLTSSADKTLSLWDGRTVKIRLDNSFFLNDTLLLLKIKIN